MVRGDPSGSCPCAEAPTRRHQPRLRTEAVPRGWFLQCRGSDPAFSNAAGYECNSENLKSVLGLLSGFLLLKRFSVPRKPLGFGPHRAGSYNERESLPQNTRSQKFKDEVPVDEVC